MITSILIEILTRAAGVALGIWIFLCTQDLIDWIMYKIRGL